MAAQFDDGSTPTAAEIDAIATRSFPKSLRGWDMAAVRVHLVSVAEIVRSLNRRVVDLEHRLGEAEAAARRADLTQLDPDEVDGVLGAETGRVLRTARESAVEIEQRAQEQASEIIERAQTEAQRVREHATIEGQRVRSEANEVALATKSAGEAHLSELSAAAESELVSAREAFDLQVAELRQATRDECAAAVATAEDAASAIRNEATEAANLIRADADAYAAGQRAEIEREVAQKTAKLKAEVDELTERARQQVAESERMRERVLADLARRRKAARQHLEQLHAGRERLLAAYEVIRTTTDVATDELGVVLSDAKRAADDAARRVANEALPNTDEMLAELELARMADLPIISDAKSTVESTAPTPGDEQAEKDVVPTPMSPEEDPEALNEAAAGNDERSRTTVLAGAPNDVIPNDVIETATLAGTSVHRRPARRLKRRGNDPLGGESLPDGPMEPIESAAEFEGVRILEVNEQPPGDEAAVAQDHDQGNGDDSGDDPSQSVESHGASVDSVAERALATVARDAERESSTAATTTEPDVTDIFERLRASREASTPAVPATSTSTSPEDAVAPDVAAEADHTAKPDDAATSAMVAAPESGSESPQDLQQDTVPAPEPEKFAAREAPDKEDVVETSSDERVVRIFERRDAAIDDVARRLSKHVKRQLSDDQSALLDLLRRTRKVGSPDEFLGPMEQYGASWRDAVRTDLQSAVAAGALLAGELSPNASADVDVDVEAIVQELIDAIAAPLYARLVHVFREGDDVNGDDAADPTLGDERDLSDQVRACYREWRGARLASAVSDVCARAFGEAMRNAVNRDGVEWHCGFGATPCSDCNDNHLAGVVAPGELFPTGQRCAPAHPGCRCLAIPARCLTGK